MFLQRLKPLKLCNIHQSLRYISVSKCYREKFRNIDEVIPKNVLKGLHNNSLQEENGFMYESRPFKILLEKDKTYAWCLCGRGKSQPLCDGTHKIDELRIKLRPIYFKVEETKYYWLCNCKQTKHRPFCDGSHIEIHKEEVAKRKELEEQRLAKQAEK